MKTESDEKVCSAPSSPMRRSGWLPRRTVVILLAATLALLTWPAQAASSMSGTYLTPARQGTIKFVPLRAFRGGVEGRFTVDGRTYPGSLYAAVGGGTGLVWYFGTSGLMAGNALVTLQPNGTYVGPVWFFDRRGNTTDSGTATVHFP